MLLSNFPIYPEGKDSPFVKLIHRALQPVFYYREMPEKYEILNFAMFTAELNYMQLAIISPYIKSELMAANWLQR